MNRYKMIHRLASGALMLLLAGCMASKGTIQSNKSDTFTGSTKRLFILANLGHTLGFGGNNDDAVFSSTMSDTLANCGTEVSYFVPDPLAIKNVANDKIRAFGPDSILTMTWQSERNSNRLNDTVVLLQLIDMKSKSVVWKASVNFSQHWNAGVTFAGLIIGRMKQDGLIDSSCAIPQVK